jgi:hypothetical protein
VVDPIPDRTLGALLAAISQNKGNNIVSFHEIPDVTCLSDHSLIQDRYNGLLLLCLWNEVIQQFNQRCALRAALFQI